MQKSSLLNKMFAPNNSEIVVLSAVTSETAPLQNLLAQSKSMKMLEISFFHFGIGPINSAKAVATLTPTVKGKHVVVIGTGGYIDTPFEIPQLYRISSVYWKPLDVRMDQSYLIDSAYPSYQLKTWDLFQVLPEANLVCSSSISKSSERLSRASNHRILENLEVYSLLPELQAHAKSFSVLIASTNETGPRSHEQWLENNQKAASMTAEFVFKGLLSRFSKE